MGGGGEHWDVATDGRIIATIGEADPALLEQIGRFLNNRLPKQQRRRMLMRDTTDRTLFEIIRQPPRPGLEYAEVRAADGAPLGTIRLIRPAGSDRLGLGLYDVRDARLGEVRESAKGTAGRHRWLGVFGVDGSRIAELTSTMPSEGEGPAEYRLHVTADLPDPLRPLVYAVPIARYFLR